jgi:hypothetical protein
MERRRQCPILWRGNWASARRRSTPWKSKYGGMEVNEARRLKELEDENRRLKHMVADLSLDREALKAVIRKNG